MVKVFVSEGTRRMAHELDDWRDRWIERKKAEHEAQQTEYIQNEEPDYGDPSATLEELKKWQGMNLLRRSGIKLEMSDIQKGSPFCNLRREALQKELEYRNAILKMLKQAIHDKEQGEHRQLYIEHLHAYIADLHEFIHEAADTYHFELPEHVTVKPKFVKPQ